MNQTVDSMMKAMGFNRCSCNDCAFHSPSVAYPLLRCNQLGGLVAPTYRCANFKPETK